jgi:hypothetical protein
MIRSWRKSGRMAGEQRGPLPASVWSAPETRGNRYAADAAADLYSAGLVAVQAARGPVADPGPAQGQLTVADPHSPVAPHLNGIFEPDADDRPPLKLVMSDLGALDYYIPYTRTAAPPLANP